MWVEQNNRLTKNFTFADFSEAFAFMSRVALLAEKMNHHPYWSNEWNTVYIELCTHDAGHTITDRDHAMAQAIDLLIKS